MKHSDEYQPGGEVYMVSLDAAFSAALGRLQRLSIDGNFTSGLSSPLPHDICEATETIK